MNELASLLKSPETSVVDVRTPEEFAEGHVQGSINIPLHEISLHLAELKKMEHIVLCCATGGRSQIASLLLQNNGIPCSNGGSWIAVKNLKN